MKRIKFKSRLAVFITMIMLVQTLVPVFGYTDSGDAQEADTGVYEEVLEEALPVQEETVVNDAAEVNQTEETFEDVVNDNIEEVEKENKDDFDIEHLELEDNQEHQENTIDDNEIVNDLDEKVEDLENEELEENQVIQPRSIIDPIVTTKTFRFKVDNAIVGGENGVQIIKNGEQLKEPQAPSIENKKFLGWYIGSEKVIFNTPITFEETDPPANIDVDVIARFTEAKVNVNFINGSTLVAVKEIVPGDTVSADGVPAVVIDPGKVFSHWSASIDGPEFDFNTTINQDTNLYLVTKLQYRVVFVSNGGSYVKEQHITAGGTVTIPDPEPERQGY